MYSRSALSDRHQARRSVLAVIGKSAALLTALAAAQAGSATPSDLCTSAAHVASAQTGVPVSVLLAISLTETGRNRGGALAAWPWTVNMEGAGRWFDDADSALSHVLAAYQRGARSFDVGCFQINYRWHGQNFASIEEMFDPVTSATYAARLLARFYRETGSWSAAAGAYHSRTERFATRYRARFDEIHATVLGSEQAPAPVVMAVAEADRAGAAARANSYPLLRQGGTQNALGSLVPLNHGS